MRLQAALTIEATCNGTTHHFDFVGFQFQELHDQLASIFGCASVVVKYVDKDGDLITMSSDSELEHAVAVVEKLLLEVTPAVPAIQPLYPQLPPAQQADMVYAVPAANMVYPPVQVNSVYAPPAQAANVYASPIQVNMRAPVQVNNVLPYPGPFVGGDWYDYKRMCKAFKKSLPKEQRRAYWAQFKQEKLQAKEARKQIKAMSAQTREERKQIKAAYKRAKKDQKALRKANKRGVVPPAASAPPAVYVPLANVAPAPYAPPAEAMLLDGASVAPNNYVNVDGSLMVTVKKECKAEKKALRGAYKHQKKEVKAAHKAEKKERKHEKRAEKDARKAEKNEARFIF